jgi:CRISPR-associated protein Cas2
MTWHRLWLVAYDIADPKRLRRLAQTLEAAGERQQHSVFDVPLSADERQRLWPRLQAIIDVKEDSVLFHPCCATCRAGIRWQGKPPGPGHEPFWIV